jgi:hypothetical protein
MIDVFIALLLAHVIADFLGQPDVLIRRKSEPLFLVLHIAIVFALTLLALGGNWELAIGIAAAHFVIDAIKVWALPIAWRDSLPAFLLDQAAHVGTLVVGATLLPNAVATGFWAEYVAILQAPAILLSGAIVSIWAGGFAVGLLMKPYTDQFAADEAGPTAEGLDNAGRMIGKLERGLIFLFLCVGEATATGFLIAAKSVLRFDTASKGQKAGEYVIIGTLASFGWGLATGYATLSLLEIAAASP